MKFAEQTVRIGVLGLARSGLAAARLALRRGHAVYASDNGDSPELRAAAAAVRAAGGVAEVGGHDIEALACCQLLVLSPGIPPTASVLHAPRLAHVPRVSELEFSYRELRAAVIAVTGTNGKSTTTALTAHLLTTAGRTAATAGNIGTPLSAVVLAEPAPDWVVVEASSFQLADIDTFAPQIGVVTNLSADHLDRYDSVEAYHADKARLFENATPASIWVLNAEDAAVLALPGEADGSRRVFRVNTLLEADEDGGYVNAAGDLCVRIGGTETRLAHASELRILGVHNRANALAAAVAAVSAGAATDAVATGLRTFGGLEHRLEPVAEIAGVLWINDSKATNIGSTMVALESMTRPVVLLLGGRHKGQSYRTLLPALTGRVQRVLAYGEAAPQLVADLAEHVPVEHVATGFPDVVARAAAVAPAGAAVLLSPACASFDMFHDYEDRGRTFKRLVHALGEADA